MIAERIAWGLFAAAALTLYLFDNNTATRLLCAAALLLPPLAALALLPRPKLSAALSVPDRGCPGESAEAELALCCDSLPVRLRATLTVENRLTGERQTVPLRAAVTRRRPLRLTLPFTPQHCGRIVLTLEKVRAVCPLGLSTRRLALTAETSLLVTPESKPLRVLLDEQPDFLQDSLRYSAQQPGYDPSEVFRIREYVPGDPLRQIHHKLSAKTDRLLVRDFGLPTPEQLLLLFDPAPHPDAAVTPEELDLLLGALFSLAHALPVSEQPMELSFAREGSLQELQIDSSEALADALALLLDTPAAHGGCSATKLYAAQHAACAFGHVAVFAPCPTPELAGLCHGNRVWLLLPAARAQTLGAWSYGAAVVPVTDKLEQLML